MIRIIQGDCLKVIRQFGQDTFGGVVTDPPYSSGGQTITARQRPTGKKYGIVSSSDFQGDGKDQRSWTNWMAEWMGEARLVCKEGAPILPGIYQYPVPSGKEKMHQTPKPVKLMQELVRIVEPGECILEPFAGSGSTLVAAEMEGYSAVGIELMAKNVKVIEKRLRINGDAGEESVSEAF